MNNVSLKYLALGTLLILTSPLATVADQSKPRSKSVRHLPAGLKISSLLDDVADRFFGISTQQEGHATHCFDLKRHGQQFRFQVVKKDKDGNKTIVGEADNLLRHDSELDEKPLISIWLSKEQKVFNLGDHPQSYIDRKIHFGFIQTHSLLKGTYQIHGTQQKRPFFIYANNFWRHRYGGEMNGVYYQDLFEGF